MEEIKVNEYVKLDDGTIGKYQINKNWLNVVETNNKYIGFDIEKDVVKHSSNIIDLIEVGDYVNGSEVVAEKYKNYDMNFINVDSKISFGWGYGVIPENDIKSIVTKERFASMEYRLEE